MFEENKKRHIRTHLFSSNYFSITEGKYNFSNIQKLKVESQTQLLNGLEKLPKFS